MRKGYYGRACDVPGTNGGTVVAPEVGTMSTILIAMLSLAGMSMAAEGSVTGFFNQVRQGDRSATRQLFQRFFPRLLGLARKVVPYIEEHIQSTETKLLIIDPLMAYFEGKTNANTDQDVRAALRPLGSARGVYHRAARMCNKGRDRAA